MSLAPVSETLALAAYRAIPASRKTLVIYRGPSMLDGAPIVVLATGLRGKGSANVKTGRVVQTWILRADADPMVTSRAAADASICGECPHRRSLGGSCYVSLFQAPLSTWRGWERNGQSGALPLSVLAGLFAGRKVRLGSYGDPAAVPLAVWDAVLSQAAGWLGYTHQWRRQGVSAAGLGRYAMASCDSEGDRSAAVAKGWRTFRVRTADAPMMRGEFMCPASAEAGHKRTCASCGACAGSDPSRPFAVSPSIIVHGSLARRFALQQVA